MTVGQILLLVAVIWAACGVAVYGFAFAQLQREFPTIAQESVAGDRRVSLRLAFYGPLSLIAWMAAGIKEGDLFKYGFKLF